VNGELVGINAQIMSPSGGSIGIGFAIPSNMAGHVMTLLRTEGRVRRALLGITFQPVTSDLAASLGLPEIAGAIVSSVVPGGLAQHLESGPPRQVQVEDDAVVVDHPRLLAGIVTVVQDVDGVPFLFEPLLEEAGDLPVVLDHEDAHAARILRGVPRVPSTPSDAESTLPRSNKLCLVAGG
jgi:hypothetical protein